MSFVLVFYDFYEFYIFFLKKQIFFKYCVTFFILFFIIIIKKHTHTLRCSSHRVDYPERVGRCEALLSQFRWDQAAYLGMIFSQLRDCEICRETT